MSDQKFHRGDVVAVPARTPIVFHHHQAFTGIVAGSYDDQFGPRSIELPPFYTVQHPEVGRLSWFSEDQLTLVKPRCMETLDVLDGIGPQR